MSRALRIASLSPLILASVYGAGRAHAGTSEDQVAPIQAASIQASPIQASSIQAESVSEVIVTAGKRVERAQDTPITVIPVSGQTLARLGAKDLFQIVTLIPGVVFSRAPDDGIALTFRGLGTFTRSAELEQSIALAQDGVPLAKGRLYSTSFFDTDRIEFIKGTEATLFGKNSSLGAIDVVDRQPGDKPSFEGRVGYEAIDGGYTADAAGDLPLDPKVQVRLAAHYNDLDGWVHNVFTDHNGPEQKDTGLRAIVRAEPNDRLTLTAFYQYADNRQIGYSMQLVGPIPASEGDGLLNDQTDQSTSRTGDHDSQHRTRSDTLSFKADWRLGSHTLTAQTSFVHYDLYYADDLDFSPDDTVTFIRKEHYNQIAQELRLQSPSGGPVDYMLGLFYLGSHWASTEDQLWATPNFPPPPDPASGQLFNGPFTNRFRDDNNSYAAYASGGWRITPRLRVTGGVRYSQVDKDILYGRTAEAPLTIWNTIANPPFDTTPLHHHSSFIDGDISLQYKLMDDVMAYVSYAHGSKAGGYVETNTIAVPPSELIDGKVPAALVAQNASLKDEVAQTYEAGVKTLWFDRSVRLNLDVFRTNIQNFQDSVFTGGSLGFITFNDPVRSTGAEAEGAWNLGHGLQIDGGLTYANATALIQPIDPETNAPEVNAAGQPVYARYQHSQAPKVIFNLNADYQRRLDETLALHLNAGLRRRSGMFNSRQDQYYSPPLTTLDLGAGVGRQDGRWSVDIVSRNVTNATSEDFASAPPDPRFGAFYGAYAASPNRLRTVMLSLSVRY